MATHNDCRKFKCLNCNTIVKVWVHLKTQLTAGLICPICGYAALTKAATLIEDEYCSHSEKHGDSEHCYTDFIYRTRNNVMEDTDK